jgi:hypothetical protein
MKSRIRKICKIHRKTTRTRKIYGGRTSIDYMYGNTNEPVQLWDIIEYINGTTSQGFIIQIIDSNIFVHFPRMPIPNSKNTYSTIANIAPPAANGNSLDESIYLVKRGTEDEYTAVVKDIANA